MQHALERGGLATTIAHMLPPTRPRPGLPRPAATLVLLLAVCAGGCAFDREWRRLNRAQFAATAKTTTAPADADPLAGRWEGRWVSERNGHAGKLRAIVKPIDATAYRVDYDAMYMGVLRFGYGMKLTAAREPGRDGNGDGERVAFEGQENLGPLAGGVYRYKGVADGRTFTATYESRHDHGRFEMTRPK